MPQRLIAALTRTIRPDTTEQVHAHLGAHGRPYVCEDPRCSSPALDIELS